MRKSIYILILCALFAVGLVIPAYCGAFDATDNANSTRIYSIPYELDITTNTGITIQDSGGGSQITPSYYTASSSNSVVNALYYGGSMLVRKASTLVSKNLNNGIGTMRFYHEITNLTNIDSATYVIRMHDFAITDTTSLNIQFDGTVTAVSSFTTIPKVSYDRTNVGDDSFSRVEVQLEEYYDVPLLGYTYVYDTWNNEVFTDDYIASITGLVNEENSGVTYKNGVPVCDVTIYVDVETRVGSIAYSVLQDYSNDLKNPYEFDSYVIYSLDKVQVDENIIDWLGDCVQSVFSIEIFENITLSTIIWAIIGVGLTIMFIKFFAGG